MYLRVFFVVVVGCLRPFVPFRCSVQFAECSEMEMAFRAALLSSLIDARGN